MRGIQMKSVAWTSRLALTAIWLAAGSLAMPRLAAADDEAPCCRERRFGPYITPDPRATAPTLAQAIDTGLLPPFGWGWYGVGFPGVWGWGGYWRPYAGYYPYPYGYSGRFWYPNGPAVPYAPFGAYGGPGYFGPFSSPGYSPYSFQTSYGTGAAPDGGAAHPGQYYW